MADIIVENSPMLSPKLKKQEDEGSILIAVQERELGNYATDAHKKKKKKFQRRKPSSFSRSAKSWSISVANLLRPGETAGAGAGDDPSMGTALAAAAATAALAVATACTVGGSGLLDEDPDDVTIGGGSLALDCDRARSWSGGCC